MSSPPPIVAAIEPAGADHALLARWRVYRDAIRQVNLANDELAEIRPELGALLAAKQAEMAVPGRRSPFRRFLRSLDIPRSTAYLLIRGHQTGWPQRRKRKDANGINGPRGAIQPVAAIHGSTLAMALTPQQAVIYHAALTYFFSPDWSANRRVDNHPEVYNLARRLASALIEYLPRDLHPSLHPLLAKWDTEPFPEALGPPLFFYAPSPTSSSPPKML